MGRNADSTTKISHCFWIIVKRLNEYREKKKHEDLEGMSLQGPRFFFFLPHSHRQHSLQNTETKRKRRGP